MTEKNNQVPPPVAIPLTGSGPATSVQPVGPLSATCSSVARDKCETYFIGNDTHVYRVYPDSSGTGWSMMDMKFPGAATMLAVSSLPTGAGTMYVLDHKNALWSCNVGLRNWTMVGKEAQPFTVGAMKVPSWGGGAGSLVVKNQNGTGLYMLVSGASGPTLFPLCGDTDYPVPDWLSATVNCTNPITGIFPGSFLLYVTDGILTMTANVYDAALNQSFVINVPTHEMPLELLAATNNASGFAELFAYRPGRRPHAGIYYLGSQTGTEHFIHIGEASLAFSAMGASSNSSGLLQVFGVSEFGNALYCAQQTAPAPDSWSEFETVDLDIEFAQITSSKDLAGNTHIFASSKGGELYEVTQDSTGHWNAVKVQYNVPTQDVASSAA